MRGKTNLFSSPLEPSYNTVLDLIEVLDSLGDIHNHVGTIPLRTKAPDLASFCHIPLIRLSQVPGSLLEFLPWSDLTLHDQKQGRE